MKVTAEQTHDVPWKSYVLTTLETFCAFYVATLCMAVFFFHRGVANWMLIVFLGLLYAFVIGACIRILVKRLSLAALMIVVPIAPLLALIAVISMIPILEVFVPG